MPFKPAIIHLIRHAQGFHNLDVQFHTLQDPNLTPLGIDQCAQLRDQLGPEFHSRINLVTASPLSRTLATAFIVFQPALQPKATEGTTTSSPTSHQSIGSGCHPQILAIPDAQEISSYPCDSGSDPSVLSETVKTKGWPVDLSLVHEGWNKKTLTNRWSPRLEQVTHRARATRQLIKHEVQNLRRNVGVEEPEVVLVSHGGLLHFLTQDWEDAATTMGTGWKNCEMRSYRFWEEQENTRNEEAGGVNHNGEARIRNEDEAYLVETDQSRRSRGKTTPPLHPGGKEQENLFWETMHAWEAQGLETPVNIGWRQEQKLKQDADNTPAGLDGASEATGGTARLETEDDMPEVAKSLSRGSQGVGVRVGA